MPFFIKMIYMKSRESGIEEEKEGEKEGKKNLSSTALLTNCL